jgi:hypothetical protein
MLLSAHGSLEHSRVRLVDSSELSIQWQQNNRYVTLSHCWGKPKKARGQLKLTAKTEQRFKKNGIQLRELTKTFRDAVLFASRIDRVGYIWIDSLCIKQPISRGTDSDSDWLEQSRVMDKIYRQSYLNISATAAVDGDQGMFFPRQPEYLWEDEINVNFPGTNISGSVQYGVGVEHLTRCTLVDPSLWDDLVEKAPINRRGWVLQERFFAPRILHFCPNQIAWECAEFHDAEGYPEKDLTGTKVKEGNIVDEGRLKSLTPKDGMALRELRLKGYPDPDSHIEDLYVYELWKRVVEVYSRTNLTFSRDRLIALSGIAKEYSLDMKCDYVAGLWRKYLESQLLWQVNEVFEDGIFENPSRRDTKTPSFSWASIESTHGVTYGEATDYGKDRYEELLFEVQDHKVELADPENLFGLVKSGFLAIRARYLRQIELRRTDSSLGVPYSWSLKGDTSHPRLEHYNLYLDAPESDHDIFESSTDIYCMPAAFGERTVKKTSRYLICLLLQLLHPSAIHGYVPATFRRIGIAKLSNYADERGQEALRGREVNELFYLL